jgi:hypothetical protein
VGVIEAAAPAAGVGPIRRLRGANPFTGSATGAAIPAAIGGPRDHARGRAATVTEDHPVEIGALPLAVVGQARPALLAAVDVALKGGGRRFGAAEKEREGYWQ